MKLDDDVRVKIAISLPFLQLYTIMKICVLNTMFMGLDVETINQCEMFGLAGGVSYMFENDEGKRYIKRISDMSYVK